MENRTQGKTPNNNNSKYLDHVYCHSGDGKNFIRANNNNNGNNGNSGGVSTGGTDVFALLKENKHLKAMLILNLDLIQEQNDQIVAKEKQIIQQAEEINALRLKNSQIETKFKELQNQLHRQLERAPIAAGELLSLPPPPLAKIQRTSDINMKSIIGECNGKLISKIILHRVTIPNRDDAHSPLSSSTISDTNSELDEVINKTHENEEEQEEEEIEVGAITETEGIENTTEESNGTVSPEHSKGADNVTSHLFNVPRGAKPRQPIVSNTAPQTVPTQVCITPPAPSRGKQMPLMMWHAPDIHSDESISCDSNAEREQCSPSITPLTPEKGLEEEQKAEDKNVTPTIDLRSHAQALQIQRNKSRRNLYITTSQMYCTREWEDDDFLVENEFMSEEANALLSEAPMLEIPKWTEHELTVSYCIEGTEDLSDDTFLKRHTKLEIDEKRRKKWDVQQIREQRRIEKLKRRHCKEELSQPDQQTITSFYPRADTIQTINFVTDIPVQAFGEMVPKLNVEVAFNLPWFQEDSKTETTAMLSAMPNVVTLGYVNSNGTSAQTQQQILNSSFAFLKKRRRQQSSNRNPSSGKSSATVINQHSTVNFIPPSTNQAKTTKNLTVL